MIITCPECATRCVIDREAVGADGRRVTCGACGAEWFQLPPSAAEDAAAASLGATDAAHGASPVGPYGAEAHRRVDPRYGPPVPTAYHRGPPPPALIGPPGYGHAYGPHPAGYGGAFGGPYDAAAAPAARPTPRWARAAAGFMAVVVAGAFGAVLTAALTAPKGSSFDVAALVAPLFQPSAPTTTTGGVPDGVVFVAHGFDLVERPEGPALEIWGRVANNGEGETTAPLVEIVSRDGVDAELQRWTARLETPVLGPGESARFASRMMHPIGPVNAVDLSFR